MFVFLVGDNEIATRHEKETAGNVGETNRMSKGMTDLFNINFQVLILYITCKHI